MRKIIIVILSLFILSGCATVPPLNFSVPNVGVSNHKIDAELKSITVSLARPDEQKGDISAGMEEIPQFWKSSVEEALNTMAIFTDSGKKKASLSIKILAIDIPVFGASMTTKAIARYELLDRNNGYVIYTKDVYSSATVPASYAFYGLIRARESTNRAIQNNISIFLRGLDSLATDSQMSSAGKR